MAIGVGVEFVTGVCVEFTANGDEFKTGVDTEFTTGVEIEYAVDVNRGVVCVVLEFAVMDPLDVTVCVDPVLKK